uniref:Type I restriction enzyme, S subunit n=1 Tax=Candidatus Kentrum sp. UNK TaxID=2126344 RepID=A0A451AT78_9GAMM|nr:MAG: type I restriction enzyme, S subunit [Candidatus Kentron sp. UNK]VFK69205.1 MAG: type I restriction enzyme, S subunit [Candidatus Kentron sp. UNK]
MDVGCVAPLSSLIDIKHGHPFSSRYFTKEPTDHILLTPRNFTKDQRLSFEQDATYYDGPIPDGFLLEDGDLLVVMTDLSTEMAILGNAVILQSGDLHKKFLHNQRIGKVIEKSGDTDRTFLMYLLDSYAVRKEVWVTATGSTVLHTSPDKILNIKVWVPGLPEQRRIAHILSQWDHAISLVEELIAARQRRRKALAQRLLFGKKRFSRFVRSGAMRETRDPYPMDWDIPYIGEIAHQVSRRNKEDHPFPVLSCTKHQGLVDSARYFTKWAAAGKDLSKYKRVRRGMFVYATNHIEEGSIGYQDLHDEALVSPMYTIFKTSERIVDEFLYLILKTDRYRRLFIINTNASVDRRGGLRWKDFARIRVPVPSREEQESIAHVFAIADQEIDLLRQQLTALWRQKNGLMQRLFSGRSRVPGAG